MVTHYYIFVIHIYFIRSLKYRVACYVCHLILFYHNIIMNTNELKRLQFTLYIYVHILWLNISKMIFNSSSRRQIKYVNAVTFTSHESRRSLKCYVMIIFLFNNLRIILLINNNNNESNTRRHTFGLGPYQDEVWILMWLCVCV